jgi:hypothetical protein
MNTLELLNDLKAVQAKHHYQPLDTVIHSISVKLIQDNCKHPPTQVRKEEDSCYYGTFTVHTCTICKKVWIEKHW